MTSEKFRRIRTFLDRYADQTAGDPEGVEAELSLNDLDQIEDYVRNSGRKTVGDECRILPMILVATFCFCFTFDMAAGNGFKFDEYIVTVFLTCCLGSAVGLASWIVGRFYG